MSNSDTEQLILPREDAEALALPYSRFENNLPASDRLAKKIPYSLLSAEHIRDYVLETGLISPFYIKGGKKSRLKDAAYEGRIGTIAYQYQPGENFPKIVFDHTSEYLTVPKNSIVFVECDLDFRLPEFIALRFNLQIKHVHRGLLLGTGPLVDPGYWGKLCIPLHNLTSEDYLISRNDGLIWLEFTKTTSKLSPGSERIGRPPLGEPFWDIKKFLEKATQPIDYAHPRVGIHSAIPSIHDAAVTAAKAAQNASQRAESNARKSASRGQWTVAISLVSGFIGLGAVLVGLYQLSSSYYSDMSVQIKDLRPDISELRTTFINAATEQKLQYAEENLEQAHKKIAELENNMLHEEATASEFEGRLAEAVARLGEIERRLLEISTKSNSGQTNQLSEDPPL